MNSNVLNDASKTKAQGTQETAGSKPQHSADGHKDKQGKWGFIVALIEMFWTRLVWTGLLKLLHDTLLFISPLLLKILLKFMQGDHGEPVWHGYLYAVTMFVAGCTQTLILQRYFRDVNIMGMHLRTVITCAVYRKSLRLSNKARCESTTGKIMNLISSDAQHFTTLMPYVHVVWSGPFQIVVAIVLLWRELGPSVLAGIGVLLLLLPFNAVIARLSKTVQEKKFMAADSRVKMITEILNGIRVIKLYAWEPSFITEVNRLRQKEVHYLRRFAYLQSVSFLWSCAPFLVALSTFGVFVMVSDQNILDAQKAFVSLTLFNILRFPLFMFPMVTSSLIQAYVSGMRLNHFLQLIELNPDSVLHEDTPGVAAVIERGVFGWDSEEEPVLHNISIQFPEGQLTSVMGSVGSGKSSLLHALLGDMERLNGCVNIKGSVAYVSQQPWIFNATLRDNILFLKPYDPVRYEKVIEACGLTPDLQILPNGDMTEIGDKGINLSGGQKQRVSLARACYADADVYLLDDPLSAVDAHVGMHLLNKVFSRSTGILASKTCILTTHSPKTLPFSDRVVLMVDGQISQHGTYRQLLQSRTSQLAEFLSDTVLSQPTSRSRTQTSHSDTQSIGQDVNRNAAPSPRTHPGTQRSTDDVRPSHLACQTDYSPGRRSSSIRSTTSLDGSLLKLDQQQQHHIVSPSTGMLTNGGDVFPFGSVLSMDTQEVVEENQNAAIDTKQEPEQSDHFRLTQAEQAKTGSVRWSTFKIYFRNVGVIYCLLILISYPVTHLASFGTSLWLADWSEDSASQSNLSDWLRANPEAFYNQTAYPNLSSRLAEFKAQRDYRLGIYGVLGCVQAVLKFLSHVIGNNGTLRASSRLHSMCFESLMHSYGLSLGYMDSVRDEVDCSVEKTEGLPLLSHRTAHISPPMTEALTRLSFDIADADNVLPFTFTGMINLCLELCITLGLQSYTLLSTGSVYAITAALTTLVLGACVLAHIQAVITSWVSAIAFAIGHLACVRKLHGLLLAGVLHSPAGFFDKVPQGRVINRFAQDISTLDGPLMDSLKSTFNCFLHCTLTVCTACSINPWIVIPVACLTALYMILQKVYVANSRQLKRIESISRSPIFSHFSETLSGADYIRAYSMTEKYVGINYVRLDANNAAAYASMTAQRWLAVLLEMVGNLLILSVAIFCVFTRGQLSAGFSGLVISYALNLNQSLNWLVRMTAELENNLVCVERIDEYANIEQEAAWEVAECKPPSSWPMGTISFIDYGLRYRADLDLVLKDINLTVKRGERIGIVGRTGSGKSSLVLGLFRMLEAAKGRVVIDGRDISQLGLHDLRKRLTLIPQVHPFDEHEDSEVWHVLELANLKTYVTETANSLGLNMIISEGGSNLSMGQRQLVCLARALLRRTPILVLDEATAAVDPITDNLIQDTIRKEFSDCTVLTIAHRLNTIMDYDRILVLHDGRMLEVGNPRELIKDANSKFFALAKDAHSVE
ncbi:hypothetical protein PHET_03006 [Paragonimus heterotremus]|uniref:Uncharacterized protein n=1 Tax=Paragonimus heterotremus TaxID=100268 RepID=A0A8J4SR08_9TREM|nr:hypothetical protein PHET_03006 [Paragonimus heterotremus]